MSTQDLAAPARTWLGVQQEVAAGTRLLNRYTVREVIAPAVAGEGAVYALEGGDGSPLMAQEVTIAAESQATFEALSKQAAELQHANLVRLVETATSAPHSLAVLERVDAMPLTQRFPAGRDITPRLMLHLSEQVCDLFAYLQEHDYLVDRVDPERMWITPDDTLRLVTYRLQRETLGETVLADHFRAAGDLIAFFAARRKPDNRVALLIERCKSLDATPAFSFFELKAGLRQILSPARAIRPAGSLLGRAYKRFASLKPQHMLGIITALVILSQIRFTSPPAPITRGGAAGATSALFCLLAAPDTVLSVDQTLLRVTGTHTIPGGDVRSLCEVGDGRYLVMADAVGKELRVLDTQTGTDLPPLKLMAAPMQVFSPDQAHVFCHVPARKVMVELDKVPLEMTRVISLRGDARGFAVSPDERYLYYSDGGGVIRCRDLHADADKGAVAVTKPAALAESPNGHELWVVQPELDGISVVDLAQSGPSLSHQSAAIPLDSIGGTHPMAVTFSGDGRFVAVLCQGTGSVSILSASDRQLLGTVPTGGHPMAMRWTAPDALQLWVVHDDSPNVAVVNVETRQVTQKLRLGRATDLVALPALTRSAASPAASP